MVVLVFEPVEWWTAMWVSNTGDWMTPPRIRVLLLARGLARGGAERVILNQVRFGDDSRFEYVIAHHGDPEDALAEEARSLGIPVLWIGSRFASRLISPIAYRRMVRQWSPDIIHSHFPVTAAQCRIYSLPAILTSRPPWRVYTEHNRWPAYHILTRRLNAATILLEDAVIAVSRDTYDRFYPRVRSMATVVGNGVDFGAFEGYSKMRATVRRDLQLDDYFVVGTVANHRAEKDYPTLIRAVAKAREEVRNVVLVSVGGGPLLGSNKALARELLGEEWFRMLGPVGNAGELMSAFDVFALASRHEGMPLAVVEAMAMGLPMVATGVGALPEIVDKSFAVLVPSANPNALATELMRLAREDRTKMAAAARQHSKRFDARRQVQAVEQVYANVMAAR